ncbi:EAL domain-containing protein [Chthonobacter rhizosphaerae]|uniref:EAL domain-containing protein n=1 Tax=Chthonobacter rhizosphaerae TaxID=2735553 RepID=UPI0015EF1C68|nr:EAL domain-containing protein [Chthonobacter rhizosphaerae]
MGLTPPEEEQRLAGARATGLLDGPPSASLDALVRVVRAAFRVPVAFVSLAEGDRLRLAARCGIALPFLSREHAFCSRTLTGHAPVVVEDVRADPRFRALAATAGADDFRFYAGIPLNAGGGVPIGTLCILDHRPRRLGPADLGRLEAYGAVAVGLLEGHRLAKDAARLAAEASVQQARFAAQSRDLERRERQFRQTETLARLGGWEYDPAADLLTWSDEIYRICDMPVGIPVDLELACSFYDRGHRERLVDRLRTAIRHGTTFDEEFEIHTRAGTRKWVRLVGEAEWGEDGPVRLFGTFQDITERHLAEARLWAAANQDTLTGLANRFRFESLLKDLTGGEGAGLLMMDVDHLKAVNDSLGHAAGDALIGTVAARLALAVGDAGVPARLGGDEFAVLVPGRASDPDLHHLAARILAAMSPALEFAGHSLRAQVSIGGAVAGPGSSIEALRQNADFALYHAKESVRGGYVGYRPDLRTRIARRMTEVRRLDEALSDQRVVTWYRPVAALPDGRIAGLSAEARILAPEGSERVADLVDGLKDCRNAIRVTDHLLSSVTADLAAWDRAGGGPARVSLAVSRADLGHGTLEERLVAACAAAGVTPDRLVIDVDDAHVRAEEDPAIEATLQRIRALGARVAIAGFGASPRGLERLVSCPVDILKLDAGLVAGARGVRSAMVLTTLVDLAHRLGLQVVACGIDEGDLAAVAATTGCDLAEGDHVGQPSPAAELSVEGPRRSPAESRSARSA